LGGGGGRLDIKGVDSWRGREGEVWERERERFSFDIVVVMMMMIWDGWVLLCRDPRRQTLSKRERLTKKCHP